MNKPNFSGITRAFSKAGLKLKKHSPEILVTAGIVGVVTSTVIACKATTKLSSIIEENKKNLQMINEVLADETISPEKYSEEDAKKDTAIYYTQTAVKIAKLYAPAVILGAASISAIVAGNRILSRRNVALAAAYTVVEKGFKDYRGNVIERFGTELDKELKYGIRKEEVETTTIAEDGTEKKVKSTVDVADAQPSVYSRFFDEFCAGWQKDANYNLLFLRLEQNWANDRLKSRGYLFLNEVYEMLGIPQVDYGQVVGWIYNPDNPIGDNYVDFGLYDLSGIQKRDEAKMNFVNGRERSVLLDFNVDGNILDLI